MNDLFVYGSFKTVQDAETAASQLIDLGVPRQVIALGAERDLSNESTAGFSTLSSRDFDAADELDNPSLWDRIVGIFQSEATSEESTAIDFDGYRSAMALGDILLLVEEEYRGIIEQTVDPDGIIDEVDGQRIPSEADERISDGGSFANEDLNFHAPDELGIPQKELLEDEMLEQADVNLERDFEKDPRR